MSLALIQAATTFEGPDELPDDEPPPDSADEPAVAAGAANPVAGFDQARLAAWIEAVVDHDEQALQALYDTTFACVFGLVKRIVHQPVLAEEVVEDTYFQVWRQAARFDAARGRPLAWLLAIARSRAIDALRREARFRHDTLDDQAASERPANERPGDELLELARRRSDLHRALMLLGPQPRQLVSLAFFRGLSHEEIAQHTELALGTVKSQIRRALRTLRDTLAQGSAWARAT